MYVRNEIDNFIVYNLDEFMLSDESKTLYGKFKNHMSMMDESSSKKFFTQMKNNKTLDLLILEKELMDL